MAGINLLGLDVGTVRVGVALSRADVQVPVALDTLPRTAEDFWVRLEALLTQNEIEAIVVGLPRGLNGQETRQTAAVRSFAKELAEHTNLPIAFQDEALTSLQAETVLKQTNKPYRKSDIDARAACYILNDYLEDTKVITQ